MTKNNFYMAGTEGTGEYLVLASTARGRIGVRVLDGNTKAMASAKLARVRVEPAKVKNGAAEEMAKCLPSSSWKHPANFQQRYSTVVDGGAKKLRRRLVRGLKALGVADGLKTKTNPKAPKWAQNLVASVAAN